jgi:hypothetical protein
MTKGILGEVAAFCVVLLQSNRLGLETWRKWYRALPPKHKVLEFKFQYSQNTHTHTHTHTQITTG